MIEVRDITAPTDKSEICEKVLRSLPDWFGIEKAIINYIEETQNMPMFAAFSNDDLMGFISINQHNKFTGEIHVMGLLPQHHRKGAGQLLVCHAEEYLAKNNFSFLTVKTLGPSRESEQYQKTRLFYEKMGFLPLEEFKTLWDEANPCLFMAKALNS